MSFTTTRFTKFNVTMFVYKNNSETVPVSGIFIKIDNLLRAQTGDNHLAFFEP
jgi:hypothetical protein